MTKKMKIRGKKGDERIVFFFMFIVWVILIISVMFGVYMVYSQDKDIKEFQSEVISNKIYNCIIQENKLIPEIQNNNEFDLIKKCNFEKNVIENNNYFINISINDINKKELIREDIIIGNKDFITQCEIIEESSAINYARCFKKEINGFLGEKSVKIIIFVGSNYGGKRF